MSRRTSTKVPARKGEVVNEHRRRISAVRSLAHVVGTKYGLKDEAFESYVRGLTQCKEKDVLNVVDVDVLERMVTFHGGKISDNVKKDKGVVNAMLNWNAKNMKMKSEVVPESEVATKSNAEKGPRVRVAIPRRTFEVWVRGRFRGTKGERSWRAGIIKARTFKEACRFLAKIDDKFSAHFDEKNLTFRGCELFEEGV